LFKKRIKENLKMLKTGPGKLGRDMFNASYGFINCFGVGRRATAGGRWFQWYTVLGKNENL
jgi:hypothetical protein